MVENQDTGATSTYLYHDKGRIEYRTDKNGKETTIHYDVDGDVVENSVNLKDRLW
jgi:uncharacterized protein RhaS with RHS repeats